MRHAVVAVALIAFTGSAAAEPEEIDDEVIDPDFGVSALVGTDLGRDVSAGVQIEAYRLRLMANAGWLPEPYAWGLKKFFEATHSNRDAVGDLLEDLVKNEFVFSTNLTFRLMPDHGLYFGAGYTLQIASKNGVLETAIQQGTGQPIPASDEDAPRTFNTDVKVHMVDARVGWQWGWHRGFTLRADIGVMKVVHTSTTLTPNFEPAMPDATRAFTDAASRVLENAGTDIWAPVGSVFLGYRF